MTYFLIFLLYIAIALCALLIALGITAYRRYNSIAYARLRPYNRPKYLGALKGFIFFLVGTSVLGTLIGFTVVALVETQTL